MAVDKQFMMSSALCTVTAVTPERMYIAPHPRLREYISHYTIYTPQTEVTPDSLTIVPDASGSIVCRLAEGQGVETCFWGPSSCSVVVEKNAAKYPLYLMIEFLPGGANRLFRLPMSELHNAMIPLQTLNTALHRTLVECLERLVIRQSMAALCASLDAVFLQQLTHGDDSGHVRHVLHEVRRTNGTLRISELSRQLGCSPRQLARVMSERLGMPAKLLARIVRINAACRRMDSSFVSLTELAHAFHYHDQSHFIHDFTDVCGVTPGEYLSRMSHFYNEELKLGAILPRK